MPIIIKGKDYVNNPENKFTVTELGAVVQIPIPCQHDPYYGGLA
jgi:hypothetical protein